jgi:orotate phosphoribosyltransferase
MEKCQCVQSGFCEFFNQEMTYSPPNWQWCQGATPEERAKYKIDCDKKHARHETFLGTEYIKSSQLIEDCKILLLPKIGHLNLKGVLGIPRSGMFPASMIALWLNLPLYRINEAGKLEVMSARTDFGGQRMKDHEESDGKVLVIDDTIYAGRAITNMREKINEEVIYAAVYAHPDSVDKVDVYGKKLSPPHILEWNLFNCCYIESTLLDFDGILCPNVPYNKCRNEEEYIDYIKNVEPFYHRIPKTFCRGIVTARLEKYRDITEGWLEKHGIKYGSLKMFPTEKEEIRDKNHIRESANFKAQCFKTSGAHFFIESDLSEARIIRKRSGKFVICPDE